MREHDLSCAESRARPSSSDEYTNPIRSKDAVRFLWRITACSDSTDGGSFTNIHEFMESYEVKKPPATVASLSLELKLHILAACGTFQDLYALVTTSQQFLLAFDTYPKTVLQGVLSHYPPHIQRLIDLTVELRHMPKWFKVGRYEIIRDMLKQHLDPCTARPNLNVALSRGAFHLLAGLSSMEADNNLMADTFIKTTLVKCNHFFLYIRESRKTGMSSNLPVQQPPPAAALEVSESERYRITRALWQLQLFAALIPRLALKLGPEILLFETMSWWEMEEMTTMGSFLVTLAKELKALEPYLGEDERCQVPGSLISRLCKAGYFCDGLYGGRTKEEHQEHLRLIAKYGKLLAESTQVRDTDHPKIHDRVPYMPLPQRQWELRRRRLVSECYLADTPCSQQPSPFAAEYERKITLEQHPRWLIPSLKAFRDKGFAFWDAEFGMDLDMGPYPIWHKPLDGYPRIDVEKYALSQMPYSNASALLDGRRAFVGRT